MRHMVGRRGRDGDAPQSVRDLCKIALSLFDEAISDMSIALTGEAIEREARKMDQSVAQSIVDRLDRFDVLQNGV